MQVQDSRCRLVAGGFLDFDAELEVGYGDLETAGRRCGWQGECGASSC
jgi:hypothetical protein